MSRTYKVITQHLTANGGRRARSAEFPTFEDASAYAEATNPGTDGSMFPEVAGTELARAIRNNSKADRGEFVAFEYEAGKFHNGQRYAAIIRYNG